MIYWLVEYPFIHLELLDTLLAIRRYSAFLTAYFLPTHEPYHLWEGNGLVHGHRLSLLRAKRRRKKKAWIIPRVLSNIQDLNSHYICMPFRLLGCLSQSAVCARSWQCVGLEQCNARHTIYLQPWVFAQNIDVLRKYVQVQHASLNVKQNIQHLYFKTHTRCTPVV